MGDIGLLFSRIAPVYDLLNHLFSFGADLTWRRRMVRAARPQGRRVLDVCTGTGDVAISLARAGATVTGVDLSPGMLDRAHHKIARAGVSGSVDLTVGDARDLRYGEASFDAVTIAFGLRNIPDRDRAVGEMTRVLRPGGRLLILEFAPPPSSSFGRLFRLYLERVIPLVGRLVSGSPGAYRYLFTSIVGFERPEEVISRMTASGLRNAHAQAMMGGVVQLFVAYR